MIIGIVRFIIALVVIIIATIKFDVLLLYFHCKKHCRGCDKRKGVIGCSSPYRICTRHK